jgi:hypothetical protein
MEEIVEEAGDQIRCYMLARKGVDLGPRLERCKCCLVLSHSIVSSDGNAAIHQGRPAREGKRQS